MTVLFSQFVLPISLISFAHSAIKRKLQKLPSWQRAKQQQMQLMERTSFNAAATMANTAANAATAVKDADDDNGDGAADAANNGAAKLAHEGKENILFY